METIKPFSDEVATFDSQLKAVQAEAEAKHGPEWRTLIITEHQYLAHQLSMPAHMPTTITEGEE